MNKSIILTLAVVTLVVVILIGVGGWYFWSRGPEAPKPPGEQTADSILSKSALQSEAQRIMWSNPIVSSGYIKDCSEGVCASRYLEIFKSSGDLCNDFVTVDGTLKQAGYIMHFATLDEINGNDACNILKSEEENPDPLLRMIKYAKGTDTPALGTLWLDCQFGSNKHNFDLDKRLETEIAPNLSDRSSIYGCAIQRAWFE